MLTGLFAISMDQAVSVFIATIIPTTLAASISHYRTGNVKLKTGFILVAGGIVGVVTGSCLVTITPVKVLKYLFWTGMIVVW